MRATLRITLLPCNEHVVSYTSAIIDEDLANLRGLGELGGAGDYGPVIPQTGILIRRAEGPKNTGQQKKYAKK